MVRNTFQVVLEYPDRFFRTLLWLPEGWSIGYGIGSQFVLKTDPFYLRSIRDA